MLRNRLMFYFSSNYFSFLKAKDQHAFSKTTASLTDNHNDNVTVSQTDVSIYCMYEGMCMWKVNVLKIQLKYCYLSKLTITLWCSCNDARFLHMCNSLVLLIVYNGYEIRLLWCTFNCIINLVYLLHVYHIPMLCRTSFMLLHSLDLVSSNIHSLHVPWLTYVYSMILGQTFTCAPKNHAPTDK